MPAYAYINAYIRTSYNSKCSSMSTLIIMFNACCKCLHNSLHDTEHHRLMFSIVIAIYMYDVMCRLVPIMPENCLLFYSFMLKITAYYSNCMI